MIKSIILNVDHVALETVVNVVPWMCSLLSFPLSRASLCLQVRGVAAGGIVSTPYCLLYKLFTLKLTRRQVTTMLNHRDSPYIRGLGFLYIRSVCLSDSP